MPWPTPSPSIVEEYFHALNFRSAGGDETTRESRVTVGVNRILEVLEVRKVRATFFILGRVAKVHPDMVRRIVGAGHEVASHGMSHRTIHELGPEGFRAELYDSKALLEDLTGRLRDRIQGLNVLHHANFAMGSGSPTRNGISVRFVHLPRIS